VLTTAMQRVQKAYIKLTIETNPAGLTNSPLTFRLWKNVSQRRSIVSFHVTKSSFWSASPSCRRPESKTNTTASITNDLPIYIARCLILITKKIAVFNIGLSTQAQMFDIVVYYCSNADRRRSYIGACGWRPWPVFLCTLISRILTTYVTVTRYRHGSLTCDRGLQWRYVYT